MKKVLPLLLCMSLGFTQKAKNESSGKRFIIIRGSSGKLIINETVVREDKKTVYQSIKDEGKAIPQPPTPSNVIVQPILLKKRLFEPDVRTLEVFAQDPEERYWLSVSLSTYRQEEDSIISVHRHLPDTMRIISKDLETGEQKIESFVLTTQGKYSFEKKVWIKQ